jgi:hypothetical protein
MHNRLNTLMCPLTRKQHSTWKGAHLVGRALDALAIQVLYFFTLRAFIPGSCKILTVDHRMLKVRRSAFVCIMELHATGSATVSSTSRWHYYAASLLACTAADMV